MSIKSWEEPELYAMVQHVSRTLGMTTEEASKYCVIIWIYAGEGHVTLGHVRYSGGMARGYERGDEVISALNKYCLTDQYREDVEKARTQRNALQAIEAEEWKRKHGDDVWIDYGY